MDDIDIEIDDRIVGFERVKGADMCEHPLNYRVHPQGQLTLLKRSMQRFGVTTALLGYHSERNGGKLTILDGHGRVEVQPNHEWGVLVTDLTDEEADSLLLLLDPISALAGSNNVAMLELTSKADITDPLLTEFFMGMAKQAIQKQAGASDKKMAGWQKISLALPPDYYQLWLGVLAQHDGNSQEAFLALLSNYGPFEEEHEHERESMVV